MLKTKKNNIMMMQQSGSAKKPRRRRGAGKKRLRPIEHSIKDVGLIKIHNPDDNLCLFYALNILKARAVLQQQRFSEYLYDHVLQRNDVLALLNVLKIPKKEEFYELEEWGEAVEDHYNQKYPQKKFKVFGFSESGFYKPYFKTSNNEDFVTPLSVFHKDEHFDAIKSIRSFLGCLNYCFSCEKPCRYGLEHRMSCKMHCINCAQIDTNRSCAVEDPGFDRTCNGCHKNFKNR
jgi:hypothetical protein